MILTAGGFVATIVLAALVLMALAAICKDKGGR